MADDPDALQRKAQQIHHRLAQQQARLIAHLNQVKLGATAPGGRSSFSAGARLFSGLLRKSIRLRTEAGTTAFHFRLTFISKSSPFVAKLESTKLAPNSDQPRRRSAHRHQAYIERQSALDSIRYSAVETASGASNKFSEASAASSYIDRPSAVEHASSFGNIADTLPGRKRFWEAVEEAERSPATHLVKIDPVLDYGFWLYVDSDRNAPPLIKKIRRAHEGKITETRVTDKQANEIFDYYTAHTSTDENHPKAISFQAGRGGRIQNRLVCEFPCDMTADQRLTIAKRFCEEELASKGARYHAAIHAPTKDNDERNFHLHITFYDRPAEMVTHPITGQKVWDFEIVEQRRRSNRHMSVIRPLQQGKIRSFNDNRWPQRARHQYAKIVNEVRVQHNMPPLYDARTYEKMGIKAEPAPSLTRQEYGDLRKRIENPLAIEKIGKRWERLALQTPELDEQPFYDPAIMKRCRDLKAGIIKCAPASVETVNAAIGYYLLARDDITKARQARATLDFVIEKNADSIIVDLNDGQPIETGKQDLESLRRTLAQPYYELEGKAVQAEQIAIRRIALYEGQLNKLHPGSVALPLPSMDQLTGMAGPAFTMVWEGLKAAAAAAAAHAPPPQPHSQVGAAQSAPIRQPAPTHTPLQPAPAVPAPAARQQPKPNAPILEALLREPRATAPKRYHSQPTPTPVAPPESKPKTKISSPAQKPGTLAAGVAAALRATMAAAPPPSAPQRAAIAAAQKKIEQELTRIAASKPAQPPPAKSYDTQHLPQSKLVYAKPERQQDDTAAIRSAPDQNAQVGGAPLPPGSDANDKRKKDKRRAILSQKPRGRGGGYER